MPNSAQSRAQAIQNGLGFVRVRRTDMSLREKAMTIACLQDSKGCAVMVRKLADEVTEGLMKTCEQVELDDLFLLLNALHAYRPAVVAGGVLAAAVQRLVGAEVEPGGPYRSSTGVVEPLANANIAVCMRWAGKPLPLVQQYISAYFSVEHLVSALSPFMGLWVDSIMVSVTHEQTRSLGKRSVRGRIVELQRADGSWPGVSVTVGDQNIVLSPAITTLLAIHALLPRSRAAESSIVFQRSQQILQLCVDRIAAWPAPLPVRSLEMIEEIRRADDRHEIALLPAFFAQSLIRRPDTVTESLCDSLGVANVYMWAAYKIYDDFLDEGGNPALLPSANVCMRSSLQIYADAFPPSAGYRTFLTDIFNEVEAANAWDLTHCRFNIDGEVTAVPRLPELGDLRYVADRAFFHALGPMVILAQYGIPPGDARWEAISTAFRHYLIARQLDDDLHDWRSDLKNGYATYVTIDILRRAGLSQGTYVYGLLLPEAQRIFWQDALPEICDLALRHIELSKQAFARSRLVAVAPANKLTELLGHIEDSMQQALIKRQHSQEFLRTFAAESS